MSDIVVSGCCKEPEQKKFTNLICIPNEGNPQYYDVSIVYCKNCGSLKHSSNIKHIKYKK